MHGYCIGPRTFIVVVIVPDVTVNRYGTLLLFCPVEDLTELADRPTASGQVAKGGCLFTWNFIVTRPKVLAEARRQ
jgi:hypothetical protein